MTEDLYVVFGISRDAPQSEIKKAYRELARKFHPDRNPGNADAEARFKAAAEAYRVLGDVELRAKYDGRGREPQKGEERASDLFEEIFGTRSARARRAAQTGGAAHARPGEAPPHRRGASRARDERGFDLRYTLELDFVEAALGVEKRIMVPRTDRCDACGGTGARSGTAPTICQGCGGSGTVEVQQGFFDVSTSCPKCQGAGKIIPQNCSGCQGSGKREVERPILVKVPPGVDSGTRLKLSGEGDAGPNGGRRGDLFVVVNIKPHPLFKREQGDLVTEVPVTFSLAALGGELEIPTLEGRVRMRIPPGAQTGRVFRLKGKGVPSLSGQGRGDQLIRIIVETPTDLSPEQVRAFELLREAEVEAGPRPSSLVAEYRGLLRSLYG